MKEIKIVTFLMLMNAGWESYVSELNGYLHNKVYDINWKMEFHNLICQKY